MLHTHAEGSRKENGGKSEGSRREDVSCIYRKSHTEGSRREPEGRRREVGGKSEGSRREGLHQNGGKSEGRPSYVTYT